MAIRSTFTTGEVLTAADLTDTIKGAFINTETTTARTLGTADAGNLVTLNNNSGGTVTIPTNTTWGSPLGTLVHLINIGTAGSFTVGTAAGVTLNAASATLAIQEGGTLIKTATNTWQFVKGGAGLGKAQYSSTTGSPTVTTVSGKTCVQFTGSGSITISQAGTVSLLVVGGGASGNPSPGGGGGVGGGGGGGAGGVLNIASAYLDAGTLTVTVGAGGAGSTDRIGASGNASSVANFYGVGGSQGKWVSSQINQGGSGGGGGGGATAETGQTAISGQGNAGGNGFTSATTTLRAGGGGGGATAVGANAASGVGGNGGAGVNVSATYGTVGGASGVFGGGGGGACNNTTTQGTGGSGGGTAGVNSGTSTAGTVNTGGGSGGASSNATGSGNGGSGIVCLLFG